MTMLTGGSVCSGAIDGLGLAASLAGFDILFHVEHDDWRRKVLEKHAPQYWPNSQQFKDLETLETAALPRPDVLFGGFPCQDVSLAGDRAGLGEGTRSGLWFHFRRLIGDLRPRAVVVENVPGLLSLGGSTVIADLAGLGYVGRWGVISAADACAPHLRNRVFIVAYAVENRQPGTQPQPGQSADPQKWRDSVHEPEYNGQRQHNPNPLEPGGSVHGTLADANEGRRPQPAHVSEGAGFVQQRRYPDGCAAKTSQRMADESRLGRNAHGSAARLDGFAGWPAYQNQAQYSHEPPRVIPPRTSPDRTRRVEAIGDAVVWLQAFPIFYYLHEVLSR